MGNGMNKQLLLECVRAYICDLYDEMQHGYCTDADKEWYNNKLKELFALRREIYKMPTYGMHLSNLKGTQTDEQ